MDNSEILLERAIKSLEEASIKDDLWAVGGGTVLSSVYGHRLSKDIDIFISEPQLLSRISPRFNPVTEEALDYEETNSFVSLTFPEGKIDFVPYTVSNMDMLLETNHIMNGQEVGLCRKFLNEFDCNWACK